MINLHQEETLRRNLRKTPDERVETLMVALRYVEARGQWPQVAPQSQGTANPVFDPRKIIETLNRHGEVESLLAT